jgi:DNA-binding CsgD family transcriptional regulator
MKTKSTIKNSKSNSHPLELGREAFRKQAWGAAFSQLAAADGEQPLQPDDLGLLAQAALLTGREAEGVNLLTRLHQAFLSLGEIQVAARYAFWLGFTLLVRGESAQAGGWLSRAGRLLEGQPDCVEMGYLQLAAGYREFHTADAVKAQAMFLQAATIAERFGDKDLIALGLQGQGRALIRQGEITPGVTLLDEAMVAVTAGEISPLNAGAVYCSVLEACGEIFDMQRAQEWTTALEKWCSAQPDLVPYRGHCLIRRSELLQFHGAWADALAGAQRACEWLSRSAQMPTAGEAFYQVGEVLRLRGKFSESEDAYRQAGELHRSAGPGLAQLRLAQGQVAAAMSVIRRLSEEVHEPGPRTRVLDALVEISLAAGDVASARSAANELTVQATRQGIPFLRGLSSRASGAILLFEDKPQEALAELRQSWKIWSELGSPYEASRARLLIALACRKLGDDASAQSELHAACETFQSLGAVVDLSRAEALLPGDRRKGAGPLTEREVEVLKLVASGLTNRAIAGKLFISEKTVARHLSNIFTKLDLSTRTAAAAYAHDHNLV